jgi:hypothetical protein
MNMEMKRVIYRAHYGEVNEKDTPAPFVDMLRDYGATHEVVEQLSNLYQQQYGRFGTARLNGKLMFDEPRQCMVLNVGLAGALGTEDMSHVSTLIFPFKNGKLHTATQAG